MSTFYEANKETWDKMAISHLQTSFYNLGEFVQGKETLPDLDYELLGELVNKQLLHLQCHIGLDSISIARKGAKVTAIDISSSAINEAKKLADQCNVNISFIESNVLDYRAENKFDIAYSSYGVLMWVGDLKQWANNIASNIREGGKFVLVEFHPILNLLNNGYVNGETSYFSSETPNYTESNTTYADKSGLNTYIDYRWNHNISDVIQALIDAGLSIRMVNEYPFSPVKILDELDLNKDGVWYSAENEKSKPYLYSIVAEKL